MERRLNRQLLGKMLPHYGRWPGCNPHPCQGHGTPVPSFPQGSDAYQKRNPRSVDQASMKTQPRNNMKTTVPVQSALLEELSDIRNRGNSPEIATKAMIEAQKGFGPSLAQMEKLRATLPESVISM